MDPEKFSVFVLDADESAKAWIFFFQPGVELAQDSVFGVGRALGFEAAGTFVFAQPITDFLASFD